MKDPSAVSLGRKGGLAKWSKISKKQRSAMMKKVRKGQSLLAEQKRIGQ